MRKVGIWLDQKEAIIITLDDNSVLVKTIYSQIETRERIPGESKIFGKFGNQYLNEEESKENKINNLTSKYLNSIISQLNKVDEILLFGPAQTKIKLKKLIQNNSILSLKLKDVLTAKDMTEKQKIAYVKKYFNLN